MKRIDRILDQMKRSPDNVRFSDLRSVCDHFFGSPRQGGTSHCIYKTPWPGFPNVNIQENQGMAKPYQVRQVLTAIDKLENIHETEN